VEDSVLSHRLLSLAQFRPGIDFFRGVFSGCFPFWFLDTSLQSWRKGFGGLVGLKRLDSTGDFFESGVTGGGWEAVGRLSG
jgi:hypothetical protein